MSKPLRFLDTPRASQHAAFQLWRRTHPDGAFLTMASRQRANLHRSGCPHIGNTTWPASEGGSLTKTEKLCAASPAPLLMWALEHLVEVFDCYHCARLDAKGLVPLTAFSWGYEGWGNAVDHLLEAVDAREASRGFRPPAFVDIRVRRAVRAVGFTGTAFQNRLGDRHRWMPSLGNQQVAERGTGIRIKDPAAAKDLLAFVQQMAEEKRRVLFFCSCGPVAGCHRQVVADLLLNAANEKRVGLSVEEWPGDLPRVRRIRPADGRRWRQPASLLLGRTLHDQGLATLARGSIVLVEQEGREDAMITGPAEFHDGWRLYPVKEAQVGEPSAESLLTRSLALRAERGWNARQSEWA